MDTAKKYELLAETTERDGFELHRIRACKTFETIDGKTVHAGDLGGWIANENNLSQDGNAWVAGDAIVFGKAEVTNDALVRDNAKVFGKTWVGEAAEVDRNAQVFGGAWVYGYARISDDATVCGYADVYGNAHIYGSARVSQKARVHEYAEVFDNAEVGGFSEVSGVSKIYEDAVVNGSTWVVSCYISKHSKIGGTAYIRNETIRNKTITRIYSDTDVQT